MAPVDKRGTNDEQIQPNKKLQKAKYFFASPGPVNTLTGRPEARKKILHEGNTRRDVQVIPNDPSSKDSDDTRFTIDQHHSSDDGFEGIRWRASPGRVLRRDQLPSSPLSVNHDRPVFGIEDTPVFGVEVPILNRYGQQSLSALPSLKRTRSEVSPIASSLAHTFDKSPTLHRARSSGLDQFVKSRLTSKVSTQNVSGNKLSTWMDKFELKSGKKKSSELLSSSGLTFSDEEVLQSSDKEKIGKDINIDVMDQLTQLKLPKPDRKVLLSEDPFSDDTDLIDIGLLEKGSNKNVQNAAKHITKSEPPKTNMSSDDPFSDDDEELLRVLSQLPNSLPVKNAPASSPVRPVLRLTPAPIRFAPQPIIAAPLKTLAQPVRRTPNMITSAISGMVIEDIDFSDFSDTDDDKVEEIKETPVTGKGNGTPVTAKGNDTPVTAKGNDAPVTAKGKESNLWISLQDQKDLNHAKSFQKSIQSFENSKSVLVQKEIVIDTKLAYSRPDLQRCQITAILHKTYGANYSKEQLILDVIDNSDAVYKIIVRGEYVELDFEINDIIHLIITDPSNPKLIDDTHNLLVWNPDTLLSATTVSQQLSCARRTVLQQRFKFPGELSLPIIIGYIVHAIFQTSLTLEKWDMSYLVELLEQNIDVYLLEIYSVGDKVEDVRLEIMEKHLPMIESWFDRYFKTDLSLKNEIPSGHNQKAQFSVNTVLDIEESIWSPTFGIKGIVDATIEATLLSKSDSNPKKVLLPMEIKSGRENISHQGQASLYSLLYKDRYDIDINSFLLVYTKEMITKKCDISLQDLKSLVNLRNRLSKYYKENCRTLPPLLKRSACDNCGIQTSCMAINKLDEDGTAEESGIPPEVYLEVTKHLENKPEYKEFYDFWDTLLVKEESVAKRTLKHMWTLTSKEREANGGLAIGELVIKNSNDKSDLQTEFIYIFERKDLGSMPTTHITRYDRIIVSDEFGHFAIARGVVKSMGPKTIVISTKRRIIDSDLKRIDFSTDTNQSFHSVLNRAEVPSTRKSFRLDKDEIFLGMALARFNVLNLFITDGDVKRRNLIVDLICPTFESTPLPYSLTPGKFNPDQIKAFEKALSTNDYSLILGMPGTGKTTVIAELIKFIVANGKTVLLSSYTHSAVDNILRKVTSFGINILRIGYKNRVHKDIQEFVPDETIKTYKEYLETYMEPQVVACTCLGINDVAFNLRSKFDYCIVDEASQVSMPVSLGPISFADKFILVGDHLQLPPLVTHSDPEVRRGLSQSLFKILAERSPESLVELTYQYRMCNEIMLLSNVLIYNGRLKSGSEEVANQVLHVPSPKKIENYLSTEVDVDPNSLWLHKILKPENKVVFLDHDLIPGTESKRGDNIDNPIEADLVQQTVEGLLACGVPESQIGVISFNRAQLRLLQVKLSSRPEIEILTADQYQGRDKECIIVSLVRSNESKIAGDLVREWRRVNVAITRAKSKLVILGSRSTLSSADTIKTFIDLLDDRGWIHTLAPGSNDWYKFAFTSSTETKFVAPTQSKLFRNSPVTRDVLNDMKGYK